MKDQVLFKNWMAMLGEAFDREISKNLSNLYWIALNQFTDEQCESAFKQASVSCKFFPKPAELIELINGPKGNIDDIAMVQANAVINAMKNVGAYKSVVFDDPITMAVIQQGYGGWQKMCADSNEDQNKWFRMEFAKIYKAYSSQNVTLSGKLIGIHETENLELGYNDHIPETVLIGDPGKAKQIMHSGKKEIAHTGIKRDVKKLAQGVG